MRHLKNKIQKSEKSSKPASPLPSKESERVSAVNKEGKNLKTPKTSKPIQKRNRIPGYTYTKPETLKTKNIMKNFGRAICSFTLDPISDEYLELILKERGISLSEFRNYTQGLKDKINNIQNFRDSLLPGPSDQEQLVKIKAAFQKIAMIFMKYFSVKWIFTSRIGHKLEHLKYRFKIIRRIQAPEKFVYLK